jgi:hypothetical protein
VASSDIEGDADDEHRRDSDEQAEEQVDVQVHREHVAEIGADDDQDALSDVDDVEDAEDQRQPDGHQPVDGADQQAVHDRLIDQASHLSSARSPAATCSATPVRLRVDDLM